MPWQLFGVRSRNDVGRNKPLVKPPHWLDTFDEPADCFGDELYTRMLENDWIEDIDAYEYEGDSTEIAVMAKNPETHNDFMLQFFDWEVMTRRTEDPKLSWLERQLDTAGIHHRRDGESWHAPIMYIDSRKSEQAWAILDPVDDIPDDDPRWEEKHGK